MRVTKVEREVAQWQLIANSAVGALVGLVECARDAVRLGDRALVVLTRSAEPEPPKSAEMFWQEAALATRLTIGPSMDVMGNEEQQRAAMENGARCAAIYASRLTELYLERFKCVPVKDQVDVVLTACGSDRIKVIKLLREVFGLGLKEAKDATEALPFTISCKVLRPEAISLRYRFTQVGATVELR